jgi:transcription elongation factor GreA
MNKPAYLTQAGADRLRAELKELKGPGREDLSRRLRIAIQQGDLSENADYIATKQEQGFLEGRILELEIILKDVRIIDERESGRETVDIGARVTIQEGDYPVETFHLVGPNEANPKEGRISYESPIGRVLLGKRVGDTVVATTPNGSLTFKIVEIK